jgi:hypothetical protein
MVIVKPQSNTRRIQECLVIQLISSVGYRWNNGASGKGIQLARNIIISKNIGGFAEHYERLREQNTKSERQLLAKLRLSHQHALQNHRVHLRQIISELFEQTYDSKINFIKQSVFGVDDGAPIIGRDHPVVKGMMKGIKSQLQVFDFILLNCTYSEFLADPEGARLVLFENVGDGKVKTCAGGVEGASPDQQAFADFLSGILHFRKGCPRYSLDPKEYPAKPLFVACEENVTLNDLFWLIFDDMETWQNLGCLHAASTEERLKMVMSLLDGVGSTASGSGFPSFPLISINFVAYIDALIVETPFFYAGSEARVSGLGDAQFAQMTEMYKIFKESEFMDYINRKAVQWYGRFPIVGTDRPVAAGAAADDNDGDDGDDGDGSRDGAGKARKAAVVRMSLD